MNPGDRERPTVQALLSWAILLICLPLASSLAAQESTSEEPVVESTIGAKSEEQQEQAGSLAKAAQNPIAALGARIAAEVDDTAEIDLRFLPSHEYSYQRAERPPE